MIKKRSFLKSLLVFPSSYLVVLLGFDLKYYNASEMAYTVPMYPWPTYMKFVLAVLSFLTTTVILSYFVFKQEKVNQNGSAPLIQESEAGSTSRD
ncbi:hypothetical protein CA11_09300 [Gimesia maris]|nr:hypothetical protein CA11_09300 [Gimesia maris]